MGGDRKVFGQQRKKQRMLRWNYKLVSTNEHRI